MRPPDHRYRRRYVTPLGSASVAAKNGSAAGVRPIHEEGSAGRIGEADAAHVHRRGPGLVVVGVVRVGGGGVRNSHGVVADAHVQPEPAQRGELGDQAPDVGVALDGLRAAAGRVAAAGVQTGGQQSDLLVEGVGDGGEVALVVDDVRRVSLVGEVIG